MTSLSTVANYGGRIQPQGNIKQFVIGLGNDLRWTYQVQSTSGLTVQTTSDQNTPVYFNSDLYVAGNLYNTSDIRLKENIIQLSQEKVDKLLDLKPVEYFFKADLTKKEHLGFIAQDVEKLFPNLIKNNILGYKTVNYIELIPIIISKMKSMQNEINELNGLVQELRDDIR
jgi:hypothetical protein